MSLQGVWVVEIDGMHLCRVFCGSLDMVSEQLAKAAEFSLSCIFLAELESLHSSALVHNLQSGVIPKDIEDGSVCLPEEFEPWCNNCSIRAVSGLLTGDC